MRRTRMMEHEGSIKEESSRNTRTKRQTESKQRGERNREHVSPSRPFRVCSMGLNLHRTLRSRSCCDGEMNDRPTYGLRKKPKSKTHGRPGRGGEACASLRQTCEKLVSVV
jgi:hypothetical protein